MIKGWPQIVVRSAFLYGNCYRGYRLWHGVVARAAPGVAAEDAFECEPAAFERTVFLDSFHRILRAGGSVAAGSGGERRDAVTVEPYQPEHHLGEYRADKRPKRIDAFAQSVP